MAINYTSHQFSEDPALPCAEKLVFETKQAAETTATTSDYWYGARPKAYKCRYCAHWHLSSNAKD